MSHESICLYQTAKKYKNDAFYTSTIQWSFRISLFRSSLNPLTVVLEGVPGWRRSRGLLSAGASKLWQIHYLTITEKYLSNYKRAIVMQPLLRLQKIMCPSNGNQSANGIRRGASVTLYVVGRGGVFSVESDCTWKSVGLPHIRMASNKMSRLTKLIFTMQLALRFWSFIGQNMGLLDKYICLYPNIKKTRLWIFTAWVTSTLIHKVNKVIKLVDLTCNAQKEIWR